MWLMFDKNESNQISAAAEKEIWNIIFRVVISNSHKILLFDLVCVLIFQLVSNYDWPATE